MTKAAASSISALGELISAKATVMRIEPGDVLILGNVGSIAREHFGELAKLRDFVGAAQIYAFPEDIDVTVLRPSDSAAQTSDTAVSP